MGRVILATMITVERVGKRYGRGPLVLRGVDLELPRGSLTVVLGENGCGKSTLLRVVAGCTVPTSGRVVGRPCSVAYLPERFPDQLRLSAGDYLRHFARMRGVAHRMDLLGRLGFVGDLGQPMSQLSKGNTQKVGITQAFVDPGGLLVLDEPWAGLDAAARALLGDLLGESVRSGATVVVTDHTGTAAALPGAAVHRLAGGVLVPDDRQAVIEVVLRCTPQAADEVAKLAGVHSVRRMP
ncbi:MAG: ABC transporter ATP-binding protein [Kutzneria sp.]|nr:ABC transporter ATP-binding protein [Kutzneria sp.]